MSERLLRVVRYLGTKTVILRALDALVEEALSATPNTQVANLLGLPAISLPLFWNGAGLPVGSQWHAPFGREDRLIRVAAERHLRRGAIMEPPAGIWDAFSARFPYQETEDQLRTLVAKKLGRNLSPIGCLPIVAGIIGSIFFERQLGGFVVVVVLGVQTVLHQQVDRSVVVDDEHAQRICHRWRFQLGSIGLSACRLRFLTGRGKAWESRPAPGTGCASRPQASNLLKSFGFPGRRPGRTARGSSEPVRNAG